MLRNALFFGAIGTLVETSDMQRLAFNAAFSDAGLDWVWAPEDYRALLAHPGGAARIARYAEKRGETVDAAEVHTGKVAHFERMAVDAGLTLRPGVADLIAEAKASGASLAFVTTTGPATVQLIFQGLHGQLTPADFDFIGNVADVENGKPAPDIYLKALESLDLEAHQAIAVEDTPESAASAIGAGIDTIAFPGWAAEGRAFPGTVDIVSELPQDLLKREFADA